MEFEPTTSLGVYFLIKLTYFLHNECSHIEDVHLVFCFVLFALMFYVPSTIFQLNRDGSYWVEPVLS